MMAFKPNYGQNRAERRRAQEAKREEKRKQQQEKTARRKASLGDPEGADHEAGEAPADEPGG